MSKSPSTVDNDVHISDTIVHATPIDDSPATTRATVQATIAQPQQPSPNSHSDSYHIEGENNEYGICRRCRRNFRRPIGVNDGQAQYYRCQECESHRLEDIIMGSCILC